MAHRVLWLSLLVAPITALSYDPARSLAPLHRLLLQRTVQTQTVYLTDFHDEAKAQWLANYLDPQAPMDTVRMSNTECLPRYNGLDGFPHATNEEYLRTMIRSEPITYEVRYKVGTWAGGNQGTGGAVGPSEEPAADEAFRKGMEQKQTLDFWGGSNNAAAASTRRNNPFLGEHTAKYREYEETIVPSRFAQLLMTTQQQLAKEWRRDLCAIYDGSLILPRDPDADEAQAIAAVRGAAAKGITYLEDEEVTVQGVRVFGSPWQPEFCNWAFNLERGEPCRQAWARIPTETDVLLTHGPPLGHGDRCQGGCAPRRPLWLLQHAQHPTRVQSQTACY